MRSAILVSRIIRATETGGTIGDGAGLAVQYADAVRALNERMASAQTAIDAGQASDAVRLMETEPKLVDEVGALDFHQLATWRSLCASRGWEMPPPIDSLLVERILEAYNSSAMLEPVLKAYRKAVRTSDERQIAHSLRRLVELDSANAEWRRDLARAEGSLQKRLAGEFHAAIDDERREEIAVELLDAPWTSAPSPSFVAEASAWRSRRDGERRSREQAEDLEILHGLADGVWNRVQAESMIAHLDSLADQGTPLKQADVAFVESLRSRCDGEIRAEAEAARRAELMEALHAAVEHENPDEVRRAMAAPEFLDNPPDEDLLRSARRVVLHAEEERRRKARRIVGVVVFALAAIMGASWKIYADRNFKIVCASEAAKLEDIANGPRAHEALEKALKKLKDEKPRVYASAEVAAYESRLDQIRKDRDARIGRANDAIRRLEEARTAGWEGDPKLFDEQFSNARKEILPEDEDLSRRLSEAELDFEKVKGERLLAALAKAHEELEPLVRESGELVATLKTRFFDDVMERNLKDFRDKVALWKTSHAEVATEDAAKLDTAVSALDDPEKKSRDAAKALKRLHSASDAVAVVVARNELKAHYAGFQDVTALRPLPFGEAAISNLVSGNLAARTRFNGYGHRLIGDSEFREFAKEQVFWMVDTPTFYEIYGLDNGTAYEAFSVGGKSWTREAENLSTTTGNWKKFVFTAPSGGLILNARENKTCDEISIDISSKAGKASDIQQLLEPCIELHEVVSDARAPSVNAALFARSLWKRIDRHFAEAKKPEYATSEQGERHPMSLGRFPAYKRVQTLSQYFGLLLKLGDMPAFDSLPKKDADILRKLDDLAAQIAPSGIRDELGWLCVTDPLVQRRNAECARFLSSLSENYGTSLQKAVSNLNRLSRLAEWRVEFAGILAFKPGSATGSARKCMPMKRPGVQPDHPLYVVRMKNGQPFLRKLLIDGKAKDSWMIVPGLGEEWIPGEPLFQIRDDRGKLVDANDAVEKLLGTLSDDAIKTFESRPFWIELRRDKAVNSGANGKAKEK